MCYQRGRRSTLVFLSPCPTLSFFLFMIPHGPSATAGQLRHSTLWSTVRREGVGDTVSTCQHCVRSGLGEVKKKNRKGREVRIRVRCRSGGEKKTGKGERFRVLYHLRWQPQTGGSKVLLQYAASSSGLPASGHLADVWPRPSSSNPEQLATFQRTTTALLIVPVSQRSRQRGGAAITFTSRSKSFASQPLCSRDSSAATRRASAA